MSLKVITTEEVLAKCFAFPKQFVVPKQLAPTMDTLPLWAVSHFLRSDSYLSLWIYSKIYSSCFVKTFLTFHN